MAADDGMAMLARWAGPFPPGTVCLVGAGPGDAALISVRGAIRLMAAEVVLHDQLIGPELLDLLPAGAERIFVGKERGRYVWPQERINAELVEQARAGRRVVRLKGGDPFVFGRGGEECLYLTAVGVPFEVVPGVTAAFAAPAYAGIPLTHRGLSRSFALVTGHAEPGAPDGPDYPSLAGMDTLVFYMGVKTLAEHCAGLIAAGRPGSTPAAVIRWGTRPEQRTLVGTLADLPARVAAAGDITPPALVIVGDVINLRRRMRWFSADAEPIGDDG